VLAHPEERVDGVTGTMHGGDELQVAGLTVEALATPGHTAGMLSLLVEGNVFTGDTLFKNSSAACGRPARRPSPTSARRSWTR
jgi:glyoxylase-like metal-dependent hydrolase (beta-lactamase superfamily II)